jgi:hypothetical protein
LGEALAWKPREKHRLRRRAAVWMPIMPVVTAPERGDPTDAASGRKQEEPR